MKLEYSKNGDYFIPNLASNERLARLMPQIVKAASVTEQLKATDQMKWVGLMNTVKAQVEEIIFAELVYS